MKAITAIAVPPPASSNHNGIGKVDVLTSVVCDKAYVCSEAFIWVLPRKD